ncbi:MAG: hypothetical protein ACKORG_02365 [Actinomycetota bacterium]
MKVYPFAIASVAVLGAAGLLVGSGVAANENSTTASQQLLINQRISQAAVKRSNSSLNYLAPIRTTTTDAANTGANGVTPLSKVAGAGQGWTTAQIANQAVTPAKLSNPSYFAKISQAGAVESSTTGTTVTAAKTGTSTYTVTFPSNVSACAPVATVQTFTPGSGLNYGAYATIGPGTQNTQWVVTTYTGQSGTGTDAAGNAASGNQAAASFNLVVQC